MPLDVRGICPLLQVFDMPTSLKFYCDALGFELKLSDRKTPPDCDWVLLELNGAQLMLNTAYESDRRPPKPNAARVAAHDDASLYFACPDVDGAYRYLLEKGLKMKEPRVAPYGMKQLYFHDPDGYLLCFQWRAEKSDAAPGG